MEKKGCSWIIAMTFNFDYITLHVKITVPLTHMMYFRVKDVFIFFGNKKYMNTRSPIFNDKASKESYCVLKAIIRGEYSNPPGTFYGLYFHEKYSYGRYIVYKTGIFLYCSVRSTSLL